MGRRLHAVSGSPLIEYYKGHGILKEVDGDRDVTAVYADGKKLLSL